METFNEKKLVTKEIIPHINAIKQICMEYKLPFFFSVAEIQDEKGTKFESVILSPEVLGIELTDDRISQMLNVMNGFDTVPPGTYPTMDFETV